MNTLALLTAEYENKANAAFNKILDLASSIEEYTIKVKNLQAIPTDMRDAGYKEDLKLTKAVLEACKRNHDTTSTKHCEYRKFLKDLQGVTSL